MDPCCAKGKRRSKEKHHHQTPLKDWLNDGQPQGQQQVATIPAQPSVPTAKKR